jgi:hypothetical protein
MLRFDAKASDLHEPSEISAYWHLSQTLKRVGPFALSRCA